MSFFPHFLSDYFYGIAKHSCQGPQQIVGYMEFTETSLSQFRFISSGISCLKQKKILSAHYMVHVHIYIFWTLTLL